MLLLKPSRAIVFRKSCSWMWNLSLIPGREEASVKLHVKCSALNFRFALACILTLAEKSHREWCNGWKGCSSFLHSPCSKPVHYLCLSKFKSELGKSLTRAVFKDEIFSFLTNIFYFIWYWTSLVTYVHMSTWELPFKSLCMCVTLLLRAFFSL